VELELKEGPENAVVLNNTIMREMENDGRRFVLMYWPVIYKRGRFRIPTVKVVQWSW
jgi:hypothetical protein